MEIYFNRILIELTLFLKTINLSLEFIVRHVNFPFLAYQRVSGTYWDSKPLGRISDSFSCNTHLLRFS